MKILDVIENGFHAALPNMWYGWAGLVLMAVIFEELRWTAQRAKDNPSKNKVVYWQRHIQ
jgi:hypothetical protein